MTEYEGPDRLRYEEQYRRECMRSGPFTGWHVLVGLLLLAFVATGAVGWPRVSLTLFILAVLCSAYNDSSP